MALAEVKDDLSKYLRLAVDEEIVITRHGRPVAKLGPIRARKQSRKLGGMKGEIKVAEDFDAPLPDEIIAAFEGRS